MIVYVLTNGSHVIGAFTNRQAARDAAEFVPDGASWISAPLPNGYEFCGPYHITEHEVRS